MTDMQPQNTEQHSGLEQLPAQQGGHAERIPVLPSPEGGIETGADRREQTAEARAAAADASAQAVPTTPIQPVVQDMPAPPPPPPVTTAGPSVAGDDDVIEKEWVDKAKQIILETRDDPHTRSQRVNELQKDYLKKRYGKELGNQP